MRQAVPCSLAAQFAGRGTHETGSACRFASALAPKHANRALAALAKRHAARMTRTLIPGPLSQAYMNKQSTLGGMYTCARKGIQGLRASAAAECSEALQHTVDKLVHAAPFRCAQLAVCSCAILCPATRHPVSLDWA